MAKDKNYEARMQGMDYALRIVKEKGIDGLEKEIKMRTQTIAPLVYSRKEVDHFWNYISMCNFNNIMTASVYTLHECFGFGKDRLKKFENHFGKLVKETEDLDYLGEHYVRLEDFAIEMNEKFDLPNGINW